MGYIYDARSTVTTAFMMSATDEVSRSRSAYRGEQYDPDLGLYYLRARYYSPATGRFLSRDPKEPCNCGDVRHSSSLHKYLYAASDPVNRVDPSGRADTAEEVQIGRFTLLASICSAVSKVPGTDIGPYPAPFYPDEKWATEPGNSWQCEANAEGRITFCKRRCPNGDEEWFTWDDGTTTGENPHWDYHRCDNTTCKIYTDGTSTCPPAGGGGPVPGVGE